MKLEKFNTATASRPTTIPFRSRIRFGSNKLFSGANRYHGSTVIALQLDLGTSDGVTTAQLSPKFALRFLERFQFLPSFLPNNGISDDFIAAMHSSGEASVDLPQVLLEAILAVEHSVSFAQHDLGAIAFAAIDRDGDLPLLVWETSRPRISRQSAEIALSGVNELLNRNPGDDNVGDENPFAEALGTLRDRVKRKRLAPSTAVISLEAKNRGIPCQTLGRQHLLLGEGRLQHHFYASMTDSTSMAAQKICADKRQTNRRLSDLRLPTPSQMKVGTPDSALEAAGNIGFPVVVKPVRGKKGRGISVGLNQLDEIGPAFELAHKSGADVLIEKFVPGFDYRLLVIGGSFVAAVHRLPPSIIGDGQSTVETLIDAENENPYRDGFRGFKIVLDGEVMRHLSLAGLSLEDVPQQGLTVCLRTAANVSTGGLPIDVTDQVHPDNREMAERASLGVGLDVAGIDFITTDISRPYHEVGGSIVEINARPGLDIHTWPVAGKSRNVAGDLLEEMFPGQHNGKLPVAIICGDRGIGTVAKTLDKILRGARRSVALTLRKGYFINGVVAKWSGKQQLQAQGILLRDPGIDTLVSTVSLRHTGESGLKLERASVSVIMDRVKAGGDDQFRLGTDIVARTTTDCVIAGVGNLAVRENLSANRDKQLIIVSYRNDDPELQTHLGKNGVAVTTQWRDGENQAILMSGEKILAGFALIKLAQNDSDIKRQRLVTAFLFSIAAAYALGLAPDEIAASLSSAVEAVNA